MDSDTIQSARIAAETAANNAELSAGIALLTAVVAVSGVIINSIISSKSAKNSAKIAKGIGQDNIKSLEKRRFIDTISAQRIEWINNIRKEFVEFNKLSHTMSMVLLSIKTQGKNLNYNFGNNYQDISAIKNHIELLLNPNELLSRKIIIYLDKIIDNLASEFNMDIYKKDRKYLYFIQQVILKSEWKRIKVETERGEQITEEEMTQIFFEVGKKIDQDKFNILFEKHL
ncbi:hypothetical protein AM232_07795 [Bacillus sp. FJAT-21352]|nr:hypothetical protein AM232_07795 [Bacillus sp. FJAT-21352]